MVTEWVWAGIPLPDPDPAFQHTDPPRPDPRRVRGSQTRPWFITRSIPGPVPILILDPVKKSNQIKIAVTSS